MVLLAVCDYRYRFVLVDIGAQGRQSDGGIFRNSVMGQFESNDMDLPDPLEIYPGGPVLPYFLVGDEAFGLKNYIQKPYHGRSTGNLPVAKRIFNYRLSRARRVVENSFGIFANKWRIFRKPLEASLAKVDLIVTAATFLHNYVLMEEESVKPWQKTYVTPTSVDREVDGVIIPGDWRGGTELRQISKQGSNNETGSQATIRDELKEYFMNEGSVSWQWNDDLL